MGATREDKNNFNMELIQDSLRNISTRANETHEYMTVTLPKQMESIAELASLRALDRHEANCEARRAYPGMSAQIAEDSRVVDLLAGGKELTSRQRRINARESGGTVSLSPNGIRIRMPAWVWKFAIASVVTAVLAALGISARSLVVIQDVANVQADTDSPAVVSSRK